MPSSANDVLLVSARQLADAAAWEELIALLAPVARGGATAGELAVLYGEALTRTRREVEAYAWLRELTASPSGARDDPLHRRAVNVLGVTCFRLGRLGEAREAFDLAFGLATAASDALVAERASNNLSIIATLQDEPQEALACYRKLLPMYQRRGHQQGLAETYHNMAISFRDLGLLGIAEEYELRAIEYATQGRAPRLTVMAQIGRAEIALRRGDQPLAAATARHAIRDLAALRDPLNEGDAWRLLGVAMCRLNVIEESREAFANALSLARTHEHVFNEAEALRDRVDLWLRIGQREPALRDATAALDIFARLHARREVDALTARIRLISLRETATQVPGME